MTTITRYVFAAVLVTAALTSGLGAGDIGAQQNASRSDECLDGERNNDDARQTHCEVREFTLNPGNVTGG